MSKTTITTGQRGTVLRIILPRTREADRWVAELGPTRKLERREILLTPGRLTTEQIAKYIREYTKLRDEFVHTIRLLGVTRTPRDNLPPLTELGPKLDESWKALDQIRSQYREVQSRIERLEKDLEESKKRITLVSQLVETGFDAQDLKSTGQGFSRILGRIPTRKLQDAQREIQSVLNDQVIVAIGNRNGDWTHILVAVPRDKTTQALQTLVLHDFNQTDVPSVDGTDLKQELAAENTRKNNVSIQLDVERKRMQDFVRQASEQLNELSDLSQEALILFRAVLRIGEGMTAEHTFTILDKNPTVKVLEALNRAGALVESE